MQSKNQNGTLVKALLLIAVAIGLCLALLSLLNNASLSEIWQSGLWLPALLMQALSLKLFICAWYALVNGPKDSGIRYSEAAAHVGVTLVSKYLPGKIWGLLGRQYLLVRRGIDPGLAANLLIADQFLTFLAGLSISALAFGLFLSPWFGLGLGLLIGGINMLALDGYGALARWASGRFRGLSDRLQNVIDPTTMHLGRRRLALPWLIYLLQWLASALALCLLFYPLLAADPINNFLLVIAAIPAGMLAGFLALWAPGGIGVREGVIVGLLVLNLPLETAAAIALGYRLLCVLNDLGTGLYAFQYYARCAPDLLSRIGTRPINADS